MLFSQMLDNSKGNAFTDKPFFNQEFIRENKVHFLNGQFTYKKPGEVMRLTKYQYVYEFDTNGRLISTFETRKDDGTKDTTWNKYSYSKSNLILEHKKGDGKGFTSTLYEYDNQNNIVKESYVREYIDSLGSSRRTILDSESMVYTKNNLQTKKTVFNSYGLPYMDEFYFYNEMGYLIEHVQRLIMTSAVLTKKYEYNDNGFISSIKTFQMGTELPIEEIHYFYDENSNLSEKHMYRNGIFITEIEMIFNEKSKLLAYVLTHDIATKFIMILGFKDYIFY